MDNEEQFGSHGNALPDEPLVDKHEIVERSADGRFVRVKVTQFREELGRSECKVIYRGLNLHTGCEISWHSISLQLVDPNEVPRILQEMREITRLDHPNIVRWQHLWVTADLMSVVLITDLMPEGSLRQYLKKIKVPRERVLRQWTQQLLQALVHLHSQRPCAIVHNFLKPDSIYVIPNTGRVVVGGLCKSVIFRNAPVLFRRYEYMAPERQTAYPDPSADVYALGMTVLEICSQSQPYAECSNPGEVHRRSASGQLPEALERVQNEKAKAFILECIQPVKLRPSAKELLQHAFVAEEEQTGGERPVKVKTRSVDFAHIGTSKSKTIDVQLILPDEDGRRSKHVGFAYDLDIDTPESVACEMVQELHLPSSLAPDLTRQLAEWLHSYRSSPTTPSTPILITRSSSIRKPTHSTTHSAFDGSFYPKSAALTLTRFCSENGALKEAPYMHEKTAWTGRRSMDEAVHFSTLKSTLRFASSANDENDVRQLQSALNQIFGPHLLLTGIFGRKTEAFVKLFQEREHVPPSGIVTDDLWKSICRKAREGSSAR